MGKVSYIECDGCKKRYQDGTFSGDLSVLRWITVSRCSSDSGSVIPIGESSFCSDACLLRFLKKGWRDPQKLLDEWNKEV